MALETWLIRKVKAALSNRHNPVTKPVPPPLHLQSSSKTAAAAAKNKSIVGILSFEIAGLMLKLLHLWHSLADESLACLNDSVLSLDGVLKLVSDDGTFLLGLVCGELVENLRTAAASVAPLSLRCDDLSLREFVQAVEEFADTGRDRHGWALCSREMDSLSKTMDRYVKATASLQREIYELAVLESSLRKTVHTELNAKAVDLQQKILWKREEVKSLRERSLWCRSFDSVTAMIVRTVFTALARIKLVFRGGEAGESSPVAEGFFKRNSTAVTPPPGSIGEAALANHYAGLIILIEKMVKSPQLIGLDAREDLYTMLPLSLRSALRRRLSGVRMWVADAGLAADWREAMGRILRWLSPLAHNTIKWQSERSFEQQNLIQRMARNSGCVFLLQTLYMARKDRAEAAITELLVGLNYIWRFEREMTARALFDASAYEQHHHLQQFSA
ncbi:hypothetical protein SAY86_020560 [Trapa natans]|uniref:Uncharacterized protein n=1 Tax=Trapa natans TaxID=22666 RepID=A0AAN7R6M5_TRANT|nr:hypothetical protein SAY86_020560 [Trapa natans]